MNNIHMDAGSTLRRQNTSQQNNNGLEPTGRHAIVWTFFTNICTRVTKWKLGFIFQGWCWSEKTHNTRVVSRKCIYTRSVVIYHEINGIYHQTSNISRTIVGNTIVDHSDVVGASPVGAAPTTSSLSTQHMASVDWAKATARRNEKHLSLGIRMRLILEVWR